MKTRCFRYPLSVDALGMNRALSFLALSLLPETSLLKIRIEEFNAVIIALTTSRLKTGVNAEVNLIRH